MVAKKQQTPGYHIGKHSKPTNDLFWKKEIIILISLEKGLLKETLEVLLMSA